MSYEQSVDDYSAWFRDAKLALVLSNPDITAFEMKLNINTVLVGFMQNKIVILGCPTTEGNGLVSRSDKSLPWFCSDLPPSELGAAFLKQKWQKDLAVKRWLARAQELIADPTQEVIEWIEFPGRKLTKGEAMEFLYWSRPQVFESCDALHSATPTFWSDYENRVRTSPFDFMSEVCVGIGYSDHMLSWLVGFQKKFSELVRTNHKHLLSQQQKEVERG